MEFPADFGAHPQQRIEWWYLTGHLGESLAEQPAHAQSKYEPQFGFQLTFFRSRTRVDPAHPSRFAASQLLFAHVALTDLGRKRMRHDQRIARTGFGRAEFDAADTRLSLGDWNLARSGSASASRYVAQVQSPGTGFALRLRCDTTQPVLLQGANGWSRKGPDPEQASLYYSQPQLTAQGHLQLDGRQMSVQGRAWLDHEWSDSLLDVHAVGWDWIGMNLHDGSALTAFRLRRADGSPLFAGGSFRRPGATPRTEAIERPQADANRRAPSGLQPRWPSPATRERAGAHSARAQPPRGDEQSGKATFPHESVHFKPLRWWTSPQSAARYPVHWALETAIGAYEVRALLDDQELDSRASTGAIYWEGLSELLDASGQRIGLGYLEMTGYAAALRL